MFTGVYLSTGGGAAPAGEGGGVWGMPAPGSWGCLLRGVWSGGCLVETPPTATTAGGTHPTGMHSCFKCEKI